MLDKLKNVFRFLIIFVLFYLLSALFVYSVLHCIQNFMEIDSMTALWYLLGISSLLSCVGMIVVAVKLHRNNESHWSLWFNKNFPNFVISFAIFCIIVASITKEAIWKTPGEIKDLVTIEWTVFGLSLTIFLVWNVIIDYLKKKQPVAPDEADYVQKYAFLMNKQTFLNEIESAFSSIVLLTVNLFSLIFSTSFVYLGHEPESIITQNIVRCTFYFTVNTIIMLFFEMLKPLRMEKKELKKANAVSLEELNKARSLAFIQEELDDGLKMILESDEYSDEHKKEMGQLYVKLFEEALTKASGTNKDRDGFPKSGNESLEEE